ncbi:hypothetical protein [Candidatus Hodarchaeum mangrovi]
MSEEKKFFSSVLETIDILEDGNETILDALSKISPNLEADNEFVQYSKNKSETSFMSLSDDILDQFNNIDFDLSEIREQRPDFQPPKGHLTSFDLNNSDILSQLGSLIRPCHICGNGVFKDELINGICFECHNKKELIEDKVHLIDSVSDEKLAPLLLRIDELENEVKDLQSRLSQAALGSLGRPSSPPIPIYTNTPPPPPPSLIPLINNETADPTALDFSTMTLQELKEISLDVLQHFSISQRNLYNNRLKELQNIARMSPEQREAYYLEMELEKKRRSTLEDFKNTIKNLEELGNPLFLKMKERAESSVISGQGTFGNFNIKKIFTACFSCGATNEILEEESSVCQNCNTPLSLR